MSSLLDGPDHNPKKGQPDENQPPAPAPHAAPAAVGPSEGDLVAAVDTLAYPMLAMMADGLLLHANQAAQELLDQGRSAFNSALQSATSGQAQQLVWADGELAVHATFRPLAEPSAGAAGVPVLLMLAPPPETLFDASGFATTHNLSAAETRVLEALLHGHQADATALRLGVGVATVRSQIAAIRKKTGHDSVASLLAALGDLPPLRRTGK
jgi:DNA-binding CsgD family transcriptional regulator